jgi:Sulfotransferase family
VDTEKIADASAAPLLCQEPRALPADPSTAASDQTCSRYGARQRRTRSAPVFLLCAARSGSTLLRYLLQAQGDIECPAESNLAQALAAFEFTYSVSSGRPDQPELWQAAADRQCRRIADRTLGARARLAQRQRWCDKSLSSLEHAALLCRIFPEAQFLTLYRRCQDFIASALEASPWGLVGYGFELYARETPVNQVWSLARYWADRADLGLTFERQHPVNCLPVTYEALATSTHATMGKICAFLGLPWSEEMLTPGRVFDMEPTIGPEDYKIGLATDIYSSSIGRGAALPLDSLIPPQLLERIACLERELGYHTAQWEPSPQQMRLEHLPELHHWRAQLAASLKAGHYRRPPPWAPTLVSLELLDLGQLALIDLEKQQLLSAPVNGSHVVQLVTTRSTFREIVLGALDPAVAWHSSVIRVIPSNGNLPGPADTLAARAVLLLLAAIANGSLSDIRQY